MRTVLFLCSGNAFRSRYAELLFNQLANKYKLAWRATSRGLMVDWMDLPAIVTNAARSALAEFEIPNEFEPARQVTEADLNSADLVIAVNESEHRPVFQARFAEWEDDVEFWNIQDAVLSSDSLGLPQLTPMVELLIEDLVDVPVGTY